VKGGTTVVQQAIESTNARFVEAYNRGDVASVAALYTDDAVLLPPNAQLLRGRQAIGEFWNAARQAGLRSLILKTASVDDSGELACEIGSYTLKIQPEGGGATTDKGKYVVVWKRQADGSWKLAVDIWNTDSPLPA
jgi:uncharacterized protein (TIGR02246 family)